MSRTSPMSATCATTRPIREDRMVLAALEEGKSLAEIAQFYTDARLADEALINIRPPDVMPRATDHIAEMVLAHRDPARQGTRVPGRRHGLLRRECVPGWVRGACPVNAESTRPGTRVEVETDKRDPADFARGRQYGASHALALTLGRGFPMAHRVLGDGDEVPWRAVRHPHRRHRPEVSSRRRDRPVRRCARPPGDQPVDARRVPDPRRRKMAKSAGNIIRVSELLEKGFQPLDFRYLALTAHYRSKLDFTEAAMHAAASAWRGGWCAAASPTADQTPMAARSTSPPNRWLLPIPVHGRHR